MRTHRSLLSIWAVITVASGIASFVALLVTYLIDGAGISAAFGIAWPFGLTAAGVGALGVIGPIAAFWTGIEIFVFEQSNDFNGLVFVLSLPSCITVIVFACLAYIDTKTERSLNIWLATPCLATIIFLGVLLVGMRNHLF
ncbi:hypothetical protein [Boseongicola aestuarii]|uniref:Uncharacterized protein n=1 Tax=Boseongicola aestuarii TaxID=1470561 RepID=A0A238IZ95_9RHOB|nr:hypothetical protein [Boseongicola aestuarii]SMX22994.1 hypothetical protein BOA8489_01094 [Boseongicola aestuarii]